MAVQIAKRRFTVSEYHRMAEAGIFSEDDRVELIEGEIVEMAAIGSQHAACVDRLNRLFSVQLGGAGPIVRVQNPVQLDEFSEPEPDLTLLQPRDDFYAEAHPTPKDVLLLVEVADTSLEYDKRRKLPAYARAGIPEVWVVNLEDDTVEVYHTPARGAYEEKQTFHRDQHVRAQTLPDLEIAVKQILGP